MSPVRLTSLSDTDRAILDSINYVDSTFIPKVEFYFQKAVTFANDVIFQSRVIFSDPDMAGQISIQPGNTSIQVVFDRPYPGIPVITLTPVGHFHVGSVSESSRYGFTIEIESSSSRPLLFNWVALMVKGAATGRVNTQMSPQSEQIVPPVVSGEASSPVSTPEPVAETISEPNPEPTPEPIPEINTDPVPEPIPDATPELIAEPISEPVPETTPIETIPSMSLPEIIPAS